MFTLNPETEKRIETICVPASDYWSKFLLARAKYIASCREAGQSDEMIAESLMFDGVDHVRRIRQSLQIN